MTKFCHIMPAPYLEKYGKKPKAELVLAHVVKDNKQYADWFANNPPNETIRGVNVKNKRIMDNGAFELGESFAPSELIKLGKQIHATHLVLPDYPNADPQLTIDAAKKWAPEFRRAGFRTIFVPQGRAGSIDDFDECLKFGLQNRCRTEWDYSNEGFLKQGWYSLKSLASDSGLDIIDEIAISILALPNAYGVYYNKTQRFLARWFYLHTLKERKRALYELIQGVPLHMLGLLDGPNEIKLIRSLYGNYNIDSWDSSAAFWYALNGKEFDDTPTGSLDGKFELEVDFNHPYDENTQALITKNMSFIEKQC